MESNLLPNNEVLKQIIENNYKNRPAYMNKLEGIYSYKPWEGFDWKLISLLYDIDKKEDTPIITQKAKDTFIKELQDNWGEITTKEKALNANNKSNTKLITSIINHMDQIIKQPKYQEILRTNKEDLNFLKPKATAMDIFGFTQIKWISQYQGNTLLEIWEEHKEILKYLIESKKKC
jgi:hypothetical protein